MKNQKYYEKEILQIAIHGQAVAVHKDKLEPMVCAKEHCKDCLNCGTNGRCKDKEKTVILNWMEQTCFSTYLMCQGYFTAAAMHSISTRASFGRVLTATAQRAGKGAVKNSE